MPSEKYQREPYAPPPIMLEVYLPEFSGFSSPKWAALLAEPRIRAAEIFSLQHQPEGELDFGEYLDLLDEVLDFEKQCSEVARSVCLTFAIHLATRVGFPHGLQFERYDAAADRIVAKIRLTAVRRLLDLCSQRRHRPLEGIVPGDFEPLWEADWDSAERRSEATARCLRALDPPTVGKLLRAFVNPRIEKKALLEIEQREAASAFSDAIDWIELRAALARRRRRKAEPNNPKNG
ncbi:hypothetical protein [Bradyrhizobium sp. WSM471]|uniref:hypothetical protein n=1 Tax=Bradyrhizobium sp. WSM471 TaxID=319017 RepID=UPI00056066F5|nr:MULTISPECIES: hypothetical protein [Bradyrhizobium]UFW42303.1 hypothetical protein BcanWSM471_03585 [Bradyrhizobium canariense]